VGQRATEPAEARPLTEPRGTPSGPALAHPTNYDGGARTPPGSGAPNWQPLQPGSLDTASLAARSFASMAKADHCSCSQVDNPRASRPRDWAASLRLSTCQFKCRKRRRLSAWVAAWALSPFQQSRHARHAACAANHEERSAQSHKARGTPTHRHCRGSGLCSARPVRRLRPSGSAACSPTRARAHANTSRT
jgi:hypothetical protein